jgi:hypothetical protein
LALLLLTFGSRWSLTTRPDPAAKVIGDSQASEPLRSAFTVIDRRLAVCGDPRRMAYVVLFVALAVRPRMHAEHRFDWGTAAIGAVIAVGVVLVVLGVVLVVLQSRSASRPGQPEP